MPRWPPAASRFASRGPGSNKPRPSIRSPPTPCCGQGGSEPSHNSAGRPGKPQPDPALPSGGLTLSAKSRGPSGAARRPRRGRLPLPSRGRGRIARARTPLYTEANVASGVTAGHDGRRSCPGRDRDRRQDGPERRSGESSQGGAASPSQSRPRLRLAPRLPSLKCGHTGPQRSTTVSIGITMMTGDDARRSSSASVPCSDEGHPRPPRGWGPRRPRTRRAGQSDSTPTSPPLLAPAGPLLPAPGQRGQWSSGFPTGMGTPGNRRAVSIASQSPGAVPVAITASTTAGSAVAGC
jgi:hypothetical protein